MRGIPEPHPCPQAVRQRRRPPHGQRDHGRRHCLGHLARLAFGGIAAPLVALGGSVTAASLGTVTPAVSMAAVVAFAVSARAAGPSKGLPDHPSPACQTSR
jgi:peptidoglycan/LPS O-acetylase OafA/YrhL